MPWPEILLALLVAHVVGDFLLQTDHQARFKARGLGRDRVRRTALLRHVAVYTLVCVPVLLWAADGAAETGLAAAAVAVPHAVQDDGRLIARWNRSVKRFDPAGAPFVAVLVDQSFHVVALFALALALAA